MTNNLLIRGKHVLPHQSQALHRDLSAERIEANLGAVVTGFRVTGERIQACRDGEPGTGLPYEFLISVPKHSATPWTAFFTSWDLRDWMEAYGIVMEDDYPSPGQSFLLRLPESTHAFSPLCEAVPVSTISTDQREQWLAEADSIRPYDPRCNRFGGEITEYDDLIVDFGQVVTAETREDFIRNNDGTYNPTNGHFACTESYIAIGAPSSPSGWKCP